jgi:hypothetical protein
MHAVTVVACGRAVGGGSHERMSELDMAADLEQSVIDRGAGRPDIELKALPGPVEEHGVAERFGRSGEDEQPRLRWEPSQALDIALFDLAGDWLAVEETEPAGESCRAR